VRSREPAHPAIVSVETFTEAQLLRRSKATNGLRSARKTERADRSTKRSYLFRGWIRCSICGRKMEASPRAHGMYYRCPARTLAPNSPVLADHPAAVYLREEQLQDAVNGWLAEVFAPESIDSTVDALVDSQDLSAETTSHAQAKARLRDAEAKLRRLHAAIEAGVDPAAMVEPINQAQAQRVAAQPELDHARAPTCMERAEVYAMVDSLADLGAALSTASAERQAQLYQAAKLEIRYEPGGQIAEVSIRLESRVNSVRVRGATCVLTTRLTL
jgi:hypothetical protein